MATQTPILALEGAAVPGHTGRNALVPTALGDQPLAVLRDAGAALWENRDRFGLASRVLRHTVCDHCELGPQGLHDDTLPGRHLCLKRLQALRDHTIGAFVPADVRDLRLLRQRSGSGLRALGRVPYPFVARRGDRGFSRIGWDEALALAGEALAKAAPARAGVLAGTRGLTNETLYAVTRAARLLGVPHLDACVPPAVSGTLETLAMALGREAATCSLADAVGSDLVLLCGTRATQDQPALARVLRAARAGGTRVVAINAPADLSHADDAFSVRSPQALLAAVLLLLKDSGGLDTGFLGTHVAAWKPALRTLAGTSVDAWLTAAGARREQAEWLATVIGRASSWVSLAGPDPETMAALVGLHLGTGAIGRRHCGIVALGGGANLQGARDCGVSPVRLPGGTRLTKTAASAFSRHWGHPLSHEPGLDAAGQLAAAAVGELDVLYMVSADPLTTLGATAEPGLARVRLRIHQGTHLDPSMLVDPGETVLVLPATASHEQEGGGTLTSVERRVRYTPAVAGHRSVGLTRPAWQIPGQLAAAARPARADAFEDLDPATLRGELQALLPDYAGLQLLSRAGDWFQWGGPQLYREGAFQSPRGKARMPGLSLA